VFCPIFVQVCFDYEEKKTKKNQLLVLMFFSNLNGSKTPFKSINGFSGNGYKYFGFSSTVQKVELSSGLGYN
jgi:hypothetical protein